MPEEFDRKRLVEEKVRQEDEKVRLFLGDVRGLVADILTRKGYLPDEVERDRIFPVRVSDREEQASADFIINLGGRPYMAIKCSMALISCERHILAFSRVVGPEMVPLSVVTDGLKAHVLDTWTGGLISESLDDIPAREAALRQMAGFTPEKFPAERLEREKRVLLAFECASCDTAPERSGPR